MIPISRQLWDQLFLHTVLVLPLAGCLRLYILTLAEYNTGSDDSWLDWIRAGSGALLSLMLLGRRLGWIQVNAGDEHARAFQLPAGATLEFQCGGTMRAGDLPDEGPAVCSKG